MYEEKHTRTWETLLVPDSKGWNEVPVSLGRKKIGTWDIRQNSKIPVLRMKPCASQQAKKWNTNIKDGEAQEEISGKLVQR